MHQNLCTAFIHLNNTNATFSYVAATSRPLRVRVRWSPSNVFISYVLILAVCVRGINDIVDTIWSSIGYGISPDMIGMIDDLKCSQWMCFVS